jgi:hypothetical protein
MNYGIGQGGGFGVSIPINGYITNQGYNYSQNNNWVQMEIGYHHQIKAGDIVNLHIHIKIQVGMQTIILKDGDTTNP